MRRYEIESFYGESISIDLVKYDNKGGTRSKINNLMCLIATEEEVARWDERSERDLRPDQMQFTYRRKLLLDLLESAGALNADMELNVAARVESKSLGTFVNEFLKHTVALQRVFDMAPRADLKKKPVLQLGVVLELLGGKLKRVERLQSGKEERVIYSPDQAVYERARTYAARRLAERRRDKPFM